MKKLIHFLWIAWLCGSTLHAQERVQKVITIKNGNLGAITRTIRDLLAGSNVLVTSDNEHLILSGPKDAVSGFEEIVKQLDVAPPAKNNVETTVYMIVASQQSVNNAPPVPAELDPVIAQLKGVFPYKGFRLLDSFVLRARNGERGGTDGFVPPLPGSTAGEKNKIVYNFLFSRVRVDSGDSGRVIRFDRLQLHINVPLGLNAKGEINYARAGVETDVDVPEGKKVVVGKTSAVEGSDSALILVISAKVVD